MTTLNAVRMLGWMQLLITKNTLLERKWWQNLLLLVALVGVGFVAGAIFFFGYGTVLFLRDPTLSSMFQEAAAADPQIPLVDLGTFVQQIPSLALFVASLVLIFSGFGSMLSSLYLSGDLDMLLVRPIPMRAVFVVKFFGGLLSQYVLLFVLLAPLLVGYGVAMEYGLLYYGALAGVLVLLPLLPVGIGALLVMVVVRIIPAHRAREVVSVLGGMLALVFYVLGQFVPELAPSVNTSRGLQVAQSLDLPLFPSAWAGRALVGVGAADWVAAVLYGGLFLGVSVLVFGGCLLIAERLYYAGWSNVVIQTGRARRPTAIGRVDRAEESAGPRQLVRAALFHPRRFLLRFWYGFDAPSVAIFLKDWRIFPRDVRNIQPLIFPLAFAIIWAIRLVTLPDGPSGGAEDLIGLQTLPSQESAAGIGSDLADLSVLTALGSLAVTFFLCYTISNSIAGPAISREGRGLWVLRLAPIRPLQLLVGKLVLAFLPYPVLGIPVWVGLGWLNQASIPILLAGVGLLLLVGLGSTGLSLGLGALFPRLDWTNPQQQTTMLAGCLGLLLTPIYIGSVMAAVIGFMGLGLLLEGQVGQGGQVVLSLLGWGGGVVTTALVVWVSLYAGVQGVQRIDDV